MSNMIAINDTLPSHIFKIKTENGIEDFDFTNALQDKTIVIFGLPGAYTPTCSTAHAPGYIRLADSLQRHGADGVYCLSVNDPFVMEAWSESMDAHGAFLSLSDWNGEYTKKIGLDMDLSSKGLGLRSKRYSMIAINGIVKRLVIEGTAEAGDDFAVYDALNSLEFLKNV